MPQTNFSLEIIKIYWTELKRRRGRPQNPPKQKGSRWAFDGDRYRWYPRTDTDGQQMGTGTDGQQMGIDTDGIPGQMGL